MAEPRVILLSQSTTATAAELALSKSLDLPLLTSPLASDEEGVFALSIDELGLGLRDLSEKRATIVRVNFNAAALNHRAADAVRQQSLVKALGLKAGLKPSVLDTTAGFGKDAFLFASVGCQVRMLERSPIVHALLADGLQRALSGPESLREIATAMSLQQLDFLAADTATNSFDVVYLDPMFPARKKSAKVKKDMNLLQSLLGHSQDSDGMLSRALEVAGKRVVVKRGKLSDYLGQRKPDIEYKGRSSRFDVYLCHS